MVVLFVVGIGILFIICVFLNSDRRLFEGSVFKDGSRVFGGFRFGVKNRGNKEMDIVFKCKKDDVGLFFILNFEVDFFFFIFFYGWILKFILELENGRVENGKVRD